MSPKKFVKAILRSGSVPFALDFAGLQGSSGVQSLRWRGLHFHYRTGTSDSHTAYECFLHGKRNAYASKHLPPESEVRTIVDVGSNIGASILFWRHLYPRAQIYGFEPEPANFEILRKNTEELRGVSIFNEALGDATGPMTLIHSPDPRNEGGWSLYQRGARGGEAKATLTAFRSEEKLRQLGIEQIDILKVDTEGAERAVLRGLGRELLANTGYVCGELHGERDFELLDFLEQNGFRIGARKNLHSTLFGFEARRPAVATRGRP